MAGGFFSPASALQRKLTLVLAIPKRGLRAVAGNRASQQNQRQGAGAI
jgi:hypothetical protein